MQIFFLLINVLYIIPYIKTIVGIGISKSFLFFLLTKMVQNYVFIIKTFKTKYTSTYIGNLI